MNRHHRTAPGATLAALILAALLAAACVDPFGLGGGEGYPLVLELGDPVLTDQERAAFEEDAVRLAIRRLADTGSPALDRVNPPAALVTSLYNALVHVHAAAHPARDSVVELYRIRTFPTPATREIMVRVDPARSWTEAWKSLNAMTGHAAVDALVTQHELSVRQYYRWSIGEVALLRAARPLHAAALAARFASIAGVVWAEPNGAIGDGNDIRAQQHGDGWRLDYSVGFGDCPAGCTGRYTWSFTVSATGAVAYLGASGEAPPPPAGG